MYFLAGLMGMMALGSVAMVATMPANEPEPIEDDQDLDLDTEASTEPSLFETMGIAKADGIAPPAVLGGVETTDFAPESDLLDEAPALPLAAWSVPPMMDFDEDEEQMMVVYDDSQGDLDPALDVRISDSDPEVSEIVVDGTVLATLPTAEAPAPEQVVLVGESVAAEMELA